jgi:hypothetical protein
MAKRMIVFDAYNVIELLRGLKLSYEEIAGLGCHVAGEPERMLRPELIAVWYEEEKRERGLKSMRE